MKLPQKLVRSFSKIKICALCGKIFKLSTSTKQICCSRHCGNKYSWLYLNHKPANAIRPWDGKTRPDFTGKKHPMYGKHHSKDALAKMEKTWFENGHPTWNKGRKIATNTGRTHFGKGKNHPDWRGGVTPKVRRLRTSIEYRLWRESVYARDAWTCQDCGKKGEKLNAHHIKSFLQFPKLRFAIDNGVTLCVKCHRKPDRIREGRKK